MSITCPACNKTNQTEAACARCGCDLTRLQAVLQAAAAALGEACASLRNADWTGALEWAQQSWELCHSSEAARLSFLAAGALGYTADALQWHTRGHSEPGPKIPPEQSRGQAAA